MGKQVTFKLKEINTKETINTKTEEDEKKKSFKYKDTLYDIEINVKGEENASNLGLPTRSLDDSILIEFGPKQIQTKIEETLQDTGDSEEFEKKPKRGRPRK